MAPGIITPYLFHWYDAPTVLVVVSKTLPPEQKEIGPPALIAGDGSGLTVIL